MFSTHESGGVGRRELKSSIKRVGRWSLRREEIKEYIKQGASYQTDRRSTPALQLLITATGLGERILGPL